MTYIFKSRVGTADDYCGSCARTDELKGETVWDAYLNETAKRPVYQMCNRTGCWTAADMAKPSTA